MSLGNVDLNPQLVQAVRDAIDIVSIASENTRLTKAGQRYKGLCPLHKEKSPSFSIDPSKGLFYCFGCGAGGDAIRLHMLTSGDDFPAAIETLAQKYGIPLPARRARRADEPAELDLRPALEAAEEFFKQELARSDFARGYLNQRRMPAELVESFGLGYAPDGWRHLLEELSRRVPVELLEAAGLVARSERRGGEVYDRFRNRLIFPIRNPAGRLVGFGGRTLGDDRAKYVNTAETVQFHKSYLLYGLSEGKREMRDRGIAVLTEGYFDVLGTVASGVPGAVASMGTSLTQQQARLLARFCDQVVIAYDGDDAGEAAARRAIPLLLAEGLGVRRAHLGAGRDPDSLRLEEGPEAVAEAIAQAEDSVALEIDRAIPPGKRLDPHERAEAAESVRELLAAIPDPIVRLGYGRVAAQRLDVPEELLWRKRAAGRRREDPRGAAEQQTSPTEHLTRSHEEWVLAALLARAGSVPPEDRMPPAEAFFEPGCRELYRAYCELYRRSGAPPVADDLRRELPAAGEELAQLARILGDSAGSGPSDDSSAGSRFGLPEMLAQLTERSYKEQAKQLGGRIREAQAAGDNDEVIRLVELKGKISRLLHKG